MKKIPAQNDAAFGEKLLSALPVAVIAINGGKVAFFQAPENLLAGAEKSKVEKHVLAHIGDGAIPALGLDDGKKCFGFALGRMKGGPLLAVGFDATEFSMREKSLLEQIEQLDKFRKLAVGRELAIKELKTHIEILKNSIEGAHG